MIRTMYASIDTVKWENIEIENGIDEYCMEQNTTKPQFHDYVFGLIVLLYFHFICYFIFIWVFVSLDFQSLFRFLETHGNLV